MLILPYHMQGLLDSMLCAIAVDRHREVVMGWSFSSNVVVLALAFAHMTAIIVGLAPAHRRRSADRGRGGGDQQLSCHWHGMINLLVTRFVAGACRDGWAAGASPAQP